jgi:hypothetical protein
MGNGRIVLAGPAGELRRNTDVQEFYLGLGESGERRSYRDVKHLPAQEALALNLDPPRRAPGTHGQASRSMSATAAQTSTIEIRAAKRSSTRCRQIRRGRPPAGS